jgi:carbamate kinase
MVGRVLNREEADAEEEKGNYVAEVKGGWKRVVAAPKPVSIIEIDAIRALLDADQIVIACGGGGIPVLEQGSNLKGASAVIEKDLASGLLAKEVDADVLMILTSVDNVAKNYGTPDEKPISSMTVAQAEDYIREGHFEFASMLPKIEASIDFLKAGKDRCAIITSLDKALDSVYDKAGTVIR